MLGIGGIGMSALARYFYSQGIRVSGYDKTSTPLTDQLQNEGIPIHFTDDPVQIPGHIDLMIYTPAIPVDLKEFKSISNMSVPIQKRAEVLGQLTSYSPTIAVSGTHGKTTVSTMIAHILYNSKLGCSAFLGGISKNYNTNFLHSRNSDLIVVEADEYDKSFLQLEPMYTVVTSMDADHLDVYNSHENLKNTFREFISRTRSGGDILVKKGVELNYKPADTNSYSYALGEKSDFYARNIRHNEGRYLFDLVTPDTTIEGLTLQMPGLINVENAVAAVSISLLCGVSAMEIQDALATFSGINRRFDIQLNTEELVYIDDYAHHPEEIRGLITSVRKLYPDKKVLGIFQPHLYSRTRDFAIDFAESLGLLNEVIVLPIYAARENPIYGIDSQLVLDKINIREKSIVSKEDLMNSIERKKFDILLTIGAGDIDQLVEPLKKNLLNRINA